MISVSPNVHTTVSDSKMRREEGREGEGEGERKNVDFIFNILRARSELQDHSIWVLFMWIVYSYFIFISPRRSGVKQEWFFSSKYFQLNGIF